MQPHTDYADELATEIDHGPHWSSRAGHTPRPEIIAAPVPPRLPRSFQVSAAPLASRHQRVAPAGKISTVSHAPVRPPPPPPAPPKVQLISYAETQAANDIVTERVAPLPMSALRPSISDLLDKVWQRFAAPICGAIAGLIFVVGYLAYASQHHASVAASAGPMPLAPEVAMVATPAPTTVAEPAVIVEAAPTTTAAPATAVPSSTAAAVRFAAPAKPRTPTIARLNVPSTPAPATRSSRRAPVHFNDATPLGDLRPSR